MTDYRDIHDLLEHFGYSHLPAELQTVSKPFGDLASSLASQLIDMQSCRQLYHCLERLLEAKDSAVRVKLTKMRRMEAAASLNSNLTSKLTPPAPITLSKDVLAAEFSEPGVVPGFDPIESLVDATAPPETATSSMCCSVCGTFDNNHDGALHDRHVLGLRMRLKPPPGPPPRDPDMRKL